MPTLRAGKPVVAQLKDRISGITEAVQLHDGLRAFSVICGRSVKMSHPVYIYFSSVQPTHSIRRHQSFFFQRHFINSRFWWQLSRLHHLWEAVLRQPFISSRRSIPIACHASLHCSLSFVIRRTQLLSGCMRALDMACAYRL